MCGGKMELEAMSRYTSPVIPAVFPHLTVVLLAIGMFFTAFVYEVTSTMYTRDIYKEFLNSLVASLFMGFGVLFLRSELASTYESPRVPTRQLHQVPAFVNY